MDTRRRLAGDEHTHTLDEGLLQVRVRDERERRSSTLQG